MIVSLMSARYIPWVTECKEVIFVFRGLCAGDHDANYIPFSLNRPALLCSLIRSSLLLSFPVRAT